MKDSEILLSATGGSSRGRLKRLTKKALLWGIIILLFVGMLIVLYVKTFPNMSPRLTHRLTAVQTAVLSVFTSEPSKEVPKPEKSAVIGAPPIAVAPQPHSSPAPPIDPVLGPPMAEARLAPLVAATLQPAIKPPASKATVAKKAAPKKPKLTKAAKSAPPLPKKEEWRHWGAAKFAVSRADACKKAPAAIDGSNMPAAVKEHFKRAVGPDCKGGTEAWLTPHRQLEQMWSGPDSHHKDAFIVERPSVAEIAVLQSPDGRSYPKGAVAETARADSWTYVYEGKTYVLYLPYVCYNWTWEVTPTAVIAKTCYEISFNAPPGKIRWGVGTTSTPLPPDECNALRQGDSPWTAWYGDCDICQPALGYIQSVLGGSAFVPHKYLYAPIAKKQILRFSASVLHALVYICLEDVSGRGSCGVYVRPQDWKGRTRIDVPDALWVWDGNCPE